MCHLVNEGKKSKHQPCIPCKPANRAHGSPSGLLVRAGGVPGQRVPVTQPHPTQERGNNKPHQRGGATSV